MSLDAHAAIREILLADTAVYTIAGNRIYASPRTPDGFNPSENPGVQFFSRGGKTDSEAPITRPSMQFKCWGATGPIASDLYQAVKAALQDKRSITTYGTLLTAYEQVTVHPMIDPETGWNFVLAFFEFVFLDQ